MDRRIILSYLITYPDLLSSLEIPKNFFDNDPALRKIWSIILGVVNSGEPVQEWEKIIWQKAGEKQLASAFSEYSNLILEHHTTGLTRISVWELQEQIYWQQIKDISENSRGQDRADLLQDLLLKIRDLKRKREGLPVELTKCVSSFPEQEICWLWPNYLPMKYASLVSGDPGSGKTWWTLDLACRLSTGRPWPDGSLSPGPASSLILNIEDRPEDTLRKRISILGGNPNKIFVMDPEKPLDLSKPDHLEILKAEILRIKDLKLMIIDPLADFASINPNVNEEVRQLLNPLIKFSEQFEFCLLITSHFNKSDKRAIDLPAGSKAGFVGKARQVFLISRDPLQPELRHIEPVKYNLAPIPPKPLEIELRPDHYEIRISEHSISTEDNINPERIQARRAKQEAVEFLRELFENRDKIAYKEIRKLANESGLASATLYRARNYLGIVSTEEEGEIFWLHWGLKADKFDLKSGKESKVN